MIERWHELSARERHLVILMGVTCLIALLYFVVLKPLTQTRTQLRQTYQDNIATLTHLTNAVPQIQQYQRIAGHPTSITDNNLLEHLQSSLEESPFSSAEKTIQQTDGQHVKIQWNAIPFDQLMDWLDTEWRESSVLVSQMDVTATETSGVVKASVVLQNKKP